MSANNEAIRNENQKEALVKGQITQVPIFKQKRIIIFVQIVGWALLINCIYRWIIHYYIQEYYGPLTHTTYLTMILISFTCINKFKSIILNSITCVSFILFIIVSILFIPIAKTISTFYEGVVIHLAIALFQLFLVLNKKVLVSKKYLISGFLLYLIFISSYDSFARINAAVGFSDEVPLIKTTVEIFYILSISTLLIYFYKLKFGELLP